MADGRSCCDAVVAAATKLETHDTDISSLKHLYKPVYGLCVIFIIVGVIIVGLWQDVRVSNAKISVHEQQDNAEFYSIQGRVSVIEGKYEVILAKLDEIKKDQDKILEWQRTHQ